MNTVKSLNRAIQTMHIIRLDKLLALAILFSMMACKSKIPRETQKTDPNALAEEILFSDEQISMAGIVTGKLEQMDLSGELSCNGSVEIPPESLVSITLPLDGYAKNILAYTGSAVRKGDLIAVMEHPDFLNLQQEYMITGNTLKLLKEDLNRQETLAREDASSEKKLMTSQTDYQNTLIRHAALGEQLRLLGLDPASLTLENMSSAVRVYSPIKGFVRMNYANRGELMKAGDPIMDIEDVSDLHVHLIIYEKDAGRVKEEQGVEFTTATGDRVYHGKVHTVGKSIDEETRSVLVHVHISDPDPYLLSGMYVKARIMLNRHSVYALPEGGIVLVGGEHYIFVSSGNSFKRTQVETGVTQLGFTEIKSPEAFLGKDLVTAGAYYINAALNAEE